MFVAFLLVCCSFDPCSSSRVVVFFAHFCGSLTNNHQVRRLPGLVLLDGKTGKIVRHGADVCFMHEPESFPWRPQAVYQLNPAWYCPCIYLCNGQMGELRDVCGGGFQGGVGQHLAVCAGRVRQGRQRGCGASLLPAFSSLNSFIPVFLALVSVLHGVQVEQYKQLAEGYKKKFDAERKKDESGAIFVCLCSVWMDRVTRCR